MNYIDIPTLSFQKSDFNKSKNEILVNMNNFLDVDRMMNNYQQTHRRTFPELNIVSPTGKIANFCYPTMDGWEIVYKGKNCNIRLTYK